MAKKLRLLIRFSALGDLVLCTGLVQKIQSLYPEDEIRFLTSDAFKGFVSTSFPQPLKVESFTSKGWGFPLYARYGYQMAAELKKQGYEHIEIYDLHGVSKSEAFLLGFRLHAWILKMHVQLKKTPKRSWQRKLSVFLARDLLGSRFVHQEHSRLLPGNNNFYPKLTFTPENSKSSFRLLIAPDAQHWKKRWPESYWEDFLPKVLEQAPTLSVTLVGSAQCLSFDFQEDLKKRFGSRVENLLGKTAVTELASIAARSDLCVCGNSAWLHISEAVGTPVLALAGPIVPGFGFSPWRADSLEIAVRELKCRPCTRHGGGLCRHVGADFHACMRRISPEQLLHEVVGRVRL